MRILARLASLWRTIVRKDALDRDLGFAISPDARAFARSCVMSETGMPRFSASTIACAVDTCFATSATTASFF